MSELIGNYKINKPLSNENAGSSKWGFATREETQYFIKEFLTPVYPDRSIGIEESFFEKKKKICTKFEEEEKRIVRKINEASDGNVLRIKEFFRYGTKYYIVTDKIEGIDSESIYLLPWEDKIRILKVLSHSIYSLHKNGIVHGDLKMDNIIFTKTASGKVTAKIIDIDNCFFENNPPSNPDDMAADTVYLAPETFMFIATESGKIDSKIDVFAMGIIFHQILAGNVPGFDKEKYKSVYECVLDKKVPVIDASITGDLYFVILHMLKMDPLERLDMKSVFEFLSGTTTKKETSKMPDSSYYDTYTSSNVQSEDEVSGYFHKAGDL